MKSNKELDSILDKVTAEIRNEAIDSSVTEQAAERVWARLSAEAPAALRTRPRRLSTLRAAKTFNRSSRPI